MSSERVQRALIAVSDKAGIVELARQLREHDIEIVSTGGTARTLREGGVEVREVAEITGFPEMLGGRVKTLHPRVHGGILARRDLAEDRAALDEHGIGAIDLVVVNLYPFERRVAEGIGWDEAVEEIDIGGPTMIRAAAKNHAHVTVVTDPSRYDELAAALAAHDGSVPLVLRRSLAAAAFRRTAAYDAAITNWFGQQLDGDLPATWTEQWQRVSALRYGENPHQRAAWYRRTDTHPVDLSLCTVSGAKELSYNNLLDVGAAIDTVRALGESAAVIVKHCLPCGAAERGDLLQAFEAALAGDPLSAFGGILAVNDTFTQALAERVATPDHFFEVIHAPAIEPGAEQALRGGARWGKNLRLLIGGEHAGGGDSWEVRSIPGGVLVQDRDRPAKGREEFRVATKREPTPAEWEDLLFAWRVIPTVRSNAILLAQERSVVGVGAGQPSRVDAVKIAVTKAGERAVGSALASDAFFPFPDGVEAAAAAGITAVIQPGGSVRDDLVVTAADAAGMTLVLTGERHFKH